MVVSPWPSKLTKAHVHGGEETGPVRGSARREDVGHYSITAADTVKEEETTTADGRRNRDDAGMADAVVYLVLAARPIRCASDRSLAATWWTSRADVMARDYRQCGPFAQVADLQMEADDAMLIVQGHLRQRRGRWSYSGPFVGHVVIRAVSAPNRTIQVAASACVIANATFAVDWTKVSSRRFVQGCKHYTKPPLHARRRIRNQPREKQRMRTGKHEVVVAVVSYGHHRVLPIHRHSH
jgi:hypothetical protein